MPPVTLERADEIIARWLDGTQAPDSPAGPLFANGRYAEADIITACFGSGRCGTACSGSYPYMCC